MKTLTVLLIFLCSLTITAQRELEYNLQQGDTFKVKQQAKQHITQDLNGVDQIIENQLQSTMQFKVVKLDSESITLEMYFEHMKMIMSSPSLGELLNVDTSTADGDMNSKMFKGVLNIPIVLIMEPTGKIRSVTGGEKLIASMFKMANITDKEVIGASAPQFEKQFGSQALSNSFEQMTCFLPAKEVSVGDTWSNVYNGDLESKNTWTLSAHNKETFTVLGNATTTMSSIDENVMMVLTGNQKTTINATSKTGLFTDITVEGTYSGDTQVQANNMTIPTTITSTVTYKLFK